MLDSKAFSEAAVLEVLQFFEAQAPSPAHAHIRFMLRFIASVRLRSAELLNAKLEDFRLEPEGWVTQAHGKGDKNRMAAVLDEAFEALQE